jgi:hypothetical protein
VWELMPQVAEVAVEVEVEVLGMKILVVTVMAI